MRWELKLPVYTLKYTLESKFQILSMVPLIHTTVQVRCLKHFFNDYQQLWYACISDKMQKYYNSPCKAQTWRQDDRRLAVLRVFQRTELKTPSSEYQLDQFVFNSKAVLCEWHVELHMLKHDYSKCPSSGMIHLYFQRAFDWNVNPVLTYHT